MTATNLLDPVSDAPATLTGGEALVDSLIRQGVDTIFGLPGIQLDGLFSALHVARDQIRVIHTRHEQATAYMADGYARVTGKEGVCIVVPGPGVLNAAAGLATAYSVNSPVLCITGQIRSDLIGRGRGALHEIPDQLGLLRSLTKHAARIDDPADMPGTVETAFRHLRSGRTRPVALEIPPDVLVATGADRATTRPVERDRPSADPEAIERAARLLGAAASPLILAGGGIERSGASDVRLAVADLLQAPVVKSRNGKGAISDRHYLSHGALTGVELLPKEDVLLVIGTRFPDPSEPAWTARAGQRVVHLDVDPAELGRFGDRAIDIAADAASGLAALADRIPLYNRRRPSRKLELSALQRDAAERVNALGPQAGFGLAIRAEVPDEGIIVGEFTQVGYWAYLGLPVYAPNTFLTPGYQGTLGYGFTTAMGTKVGRPDVPVVSINGDGGFGYTLNELSTLVQHDIPVVAVVFNDNACGNVRRIQTDLYGGKVIASDLVNPDYRALAAAFGIAGRRAETPAELRIQLREAIAANEPALIAVPIGPTPDPWKTLGLR